METRLAHPLAPPRTLPPQAGERIWIAGDTMWIKAGSSDTAGAYTLLEVLAPPGGGPPPHIHEHEEETFYVLDGVFELLVGDRVMRAAAGAFALVPRGTVHRFRCVGDCPGRLLILFTPGGVEGFFREAGRPAVDDGPAPPVDLAEIARTERAGTRYGVRVVQWARD